MHEAIDELKKIIADPGTPVMVKDNARNKVAFLEERFKADRFTSMYEGEEMKQPNEGKPCPYTNQAFHEDVERRAKVTRANQERQMEDLQQNDDSYFNAERMEYAERESGIGGQPAASVTPSVIKPDEEEIIEIDTSMPVRNFQ